MKKTRRSGRPPSAREDLLKRKIEALEKEYQHGFCAFDILICPFAELSASNRTPSPPGSMQAGEYRLVESMGRCLGLFSHLVLGSYIQDRQRQAFQLFS